MRLGLDLSLSSPRRHAAGGAPIVEPWAGYFAAIGLTNPSAQAAVTTFRQALQARAGLTEKLKVFALFCGQTAATRNMMQNAYHPALVADPDFVPFLGTSGDGAASYIDTVALLSEIAGITGTDVAVGIGMRQQEPPGSLSSLAYLYADSSVGGFEAAALSPILTAPDQLALDYALGDGWSSPTTSPVSCDFDDVRLHLSRTAADELAAYLGTTLLGASSTPASLLPAVALTIGAVNSGGSISADPFAPTYRAKWYYAAQGLDLADIAVLDPAAAALTAAFEVLA